MGTLLSGETCLHAVSATVTCQPISGKIRDWVRGLIYVPERARIAWYH